MSSDPQKWLARCALPMLVAAVFAALPQCGTYRTGSEEAPAQRPLIDGRAEAQTPTRDPSAMWPAEPLPTGVVIGESGARARYLRDFLLVRPLNDAGLRALLQAYPYLSVSPRLRFETPEGPVDFPIADRVLSLDGSTREEANDVLVRIDWSALDPRTLQGVEPASLLHERLTFGDEQALALVRLVVWIVSHDSDKVAGVQPVATVVVPPRGGPTSGWDAGLPDDDGLRRGRYPITAGEEGFCPCLTREREPYTYLTPRVIELPGASGRVDVDCAEQAILSGRNLLLLRAATVSDIHESGAGGDEGNIRLWIVPEEDFPIRLPGWEPSLIPGVVLPWGVGVFIGRSGQFEHSVPPHAHESSLRGQYRVEGNNFCEWTRHGIPQTLRYSQSGEWPWRTQTADERVGALVYESDECQCWFIFCVCNPDDLIDVLPMTRGETTHGTQAFREHEGVQLSFETLAECRNDGAEVCDGLDNDCDGQVDEDDPQVGRECAPAGRRVCTMGHYACVEGRRLCRGAIEPQRDVCDGLDNDCDGQVDEDDPRVGAACGDEVGACSAGRLACAVGRVACVGGTAAATEICANGLDDDCDGGVDEVPCVCADGEVRPCGVRQGVCNAGTQRCDRGTWGACVGAGRPTAEVCDGQDNNCNGATDEGCGCASGAARLCGSGSGGTCVAGTQRCLAGGLWDVCRGNVEPSVDVCDGLDNDCDGVVDNIGYGPCVCADGAERPCGASVGECRLGVQQCDRGHWGVCSGRGPAEEGTACDGRDNNCNGSTDEGLRNLCGSCGPEPAEVCNLRDDDCDGLVDEDNAQNNLALRNACNGCGPTPAETCDDADNDCDGSVDEDLPNCGVSLALSRFEVGNGASTSATIPRPAMGTVVPLVMVDEYQTADDDDFEYAATWTVGVGDVRFDLQTGMGNGGSRVIGNFALIGLGANGAASALPFDIHQGDSVRALGTVRTASGTVPAVPFSFVRSYLPSTDDDYAFSLSPERSGVDWRFLGTGFDGNDESVAQGTACGFRFPASVLVDSLEETVLNDQPRVLRWHDLRGRALGDFGRVAPLTAVEAYTPAGDDDASWAIRCRRDGTDVVCVVQVEGGNNSSSVRIRALLLGGGLR